MKSKKNILVLCTGNSCRSQIAHAYLQKFAKTRAAVYSAGVEVHGLNPLAVATLKEDGIDISHHTSNHIDSYLGKVNFDYIITVCDHANESCPFIPSENAIRLHQNFNDPSKNKGDAETVKAAFRSTRNKIRRYCQYFVSKYIQH